MKNWLKIIFGIFGGIVLLVIIDLACIFTINRPLFAIKKDNGAIYKGMFFDTYICNEYPTPQIKGKGVKFTCVTDLQKGQEGSNKEFDFYISKEENHSDISFKDYITFDDRKYYLADNIKEFYVVAEKTMILRAYITNFDHTLNDYSITRITDELTEKEILRDGGTTIHRSKDKDVTIVECKTVSGNDNIYIGDYVMKFNESMCK